MVRRNRPGSCFASKGDGVVMSSKSILQDDLIYEILSVVEEIPKGCVATYGQIARLIGRDKNARLVGKALSVGLLIGCPMKSGQIGI